MIFNKDQQHQLNDKLTDRQQDCTSHTKQIIGKNHDNAMLILASNS